jgi:hypothetical protein
MSFYTYLTLISEDDTAQGDLARDILNDTNIKNSSGIRYIRRYFKEICVSPHILYLLEETYINYKSSKITG